MCTEYDENRLPVSLSLEESGIIIHMIVAQINKLRDALLKPRVGFYKNDEDVIRHEMNKLTSAYTRLARCNDALMGKEGGGEYVVICLGDDGKYIQARREPFTCGDEIERYMATISPARKPVAVQVEEKSKS